MDPERVRCIAEGCDHPILPETAARTGGYVCGASENERRRNAQKADLDKMPVIHLETIIEAPRERVFDLARSIDAHQDTAEHTGEHAIAGTTSGLLELGGEVTWEARHLGVKQRLRVQMTECDRPNHFQDIMLEGAFREMKPDHRFEIQDGCTVMIDRFEFRSPFGPLGWLVDRLFLTGYMRRFLVQRNAILKRTAESEDWRKYLGGA